MPVVGDGSTCACAVVSMARSQGRVQVHAVCLNAVPAYRHDGQEQWTLQRHVRIIVCSLQLLQGKARSLLPCWLVLLVSHLLCQYMLLGAWTRVQKTILRCNAVQRRRASKPKTCFPGFRNA